MPTGKSRNDVISKIKTSVHTKDNSDDFFNIPWYAYGTNNKSKNEVSDSSSAPKSKNKSRKSSGRKDSKDKIVNPFQALISKKTYNEMSNANQNNIVTANNSSGTSTQGSSTRDVKSSAKKRTLQQEWYYKSSDASSNLNYWQAEQIQDSNKERASSNFQFEAASPNIFIVEESKRSLDEHKHLIHRKVANQRIGLHEYSLGDNNDKHNVRYYL